MTVHAETDTARPTGQWRRWLDEISTNGAGSGVKRRPPTAQELRLIERAADRILEYRRARDRGRDPEDVGDATAYEIVHVGVAGSNGFSLRDGATYLLRCAADLADALEEADRAA